MGWVYSTCGEGRGVYRPLVGKLRERDRLEDPGRREDNIKMVLQEVGWGAWTGLIWLSIGTGGGHLKNAVMKLRVP
jgi:hypothetical protein